MIKEHLRILFLILSLSISGITFGQEEPELKFLDSLEVADMKALGYYNYDVPRNMYISSYKGNLGSDSYSNANKDDIYLVGWSADGYCAYVIEPELERSEDYFVEFYIHNIHSDSIVWFYRYDNSAWREKYYAAPKSHRDSLRDEHRCYNLSCTWKTFYDTLSSEFFKYNIIPNNLRPYSHANDDVRSDQKYNSILKDSTDTTWVDITLFYEFDKDTIYKRVKLSDDALGLNYHGYIAHPDSSEWGIMVLSEKFEGIDSLSPQSWHYALKGFVRSSELPFTRHELDFNTQKQDEAPYRHIDLIEKMYDRVTNMEEEEWLRNYGRNYAVSYFDENDYVFPDGYRDVEYMTRFKHDNQDYYLDRSFTYKEYEFYVYGIKEEDEIRNSYQLMALKSENDSLLLWSDVNDNKLEHGGIEYIIMDDSIAYISVCSQESQKQFGYILAMDMTTMKVLWRTESNISNSHSFTLREDVILTGYGDDKTNLLCLINKYNGQLVKTITLPSQPLWVKNAGDKIVVKTEQSTHEFSVKSSFFKSL